MHTQNEPEVPVSEVPENAVLLDVREDDEWAAGHAPGAVHLAMTTLAEHLDEVPDGSPTYVICRSGGRSARVTGYLNANGWEAVNVAGGMNSWAAARRPLVSESDQPATVI